MGLNGLGESLERSRVYNPVRLAEASENGTGVQTSTNVPTTTGGNQRMKEVAEGVPKGRDGGLSEAAMLSCQSNRHDRRLVNFFRNGTA